MILFGSGITITTSEQKCLLHLETAPDTWLTNVVASKATGRRDALLRVWRPILLADPSVTELPATSDGLVNVILARSDYKSRAQKDAAASEDDYRFGTAAYNAVDRSGTTATLVSSGITLEDLDNSVILAYLQDVNDWILGAVMGHINRGRKKMFAQYMPVILDDDDVTTMPATDAGLVDLITARSDYQTLPVQWSR